MHSKPTYPNRITVAKVRAAENSVKPFPEPDIEQMLIDARRDPETATLQEGGGQVSVTSM
ncbi:unnamed protein product [Protopolystoma xenopodis]|uniref:Uncharacterized protein n=1 Tax=Protopolystoma xenopodis TaxID=117903 RepID=A0A3S5FCS9_9PLAT|nr:unnamed protein product [Protopolystoma xenopodis]